MLLKNKIYKKNFNKEEAMSNENVVEIDVELTLNQPQEKTNARVPVVDIDINLESEKPKLTEEELAQKEKELLGDFVMPTLEDAHIVFQLGEQVGPLDVLLELIKQTKLDIMEVNLADLTEQFLDYMEASKMNMEQKSEFVAVAATLLEIKSKQLLPVEPDADELEEEDPEIAMKKQLQMYKLFKEASEELALHENNDHFYKEPDKSAGDFKIVLKNMDMDGLVQAFSKLLIKVKQNENKAEEKQIENDRFTLAESIINLRENLVNKKRLKFSECFGNDFSRGEIIITFLALLELLKTQIAQATQSETYGEIEIVLREKEEQNEQTNAG